MSVPPFSFFSKGIILKDPWETPSQAPCHERLLCYIWKGWNLFFYFCSTHIVSMSSVSKHCAEYWRWEMSMLLPWELWHINRSSHELWWVPMETGLWNAVFGWQGKQICELQMLQWTRVCLVGIQWRMIENFRHQEEHKIPQGLERAWHSSRTQRLSKLMWQTD